MKFRKLPVEIEAIRINLSRGRQNWNLVTEFFGSKSGGGTWQSFAGSVKIFTLEGVMTAEPGDWIIKGIAGEFYPCKHAIFVKTYEQVEEGE